MKNTSKKPAGLISQVGWLLVRFVVVLIFGCSVAIVLSMLLVKIQGEASVITVINNEIKQANELLIKHTDGSGNSLLTEWSQVIPQGNISPPLLLPVIAKDTQQQVWEEIKPFVVVSLASVKLSLLRFEIFMHWLELCMLLTIVALFDGLSQRIIRRVSGGRESALIYHTAKSLVMLNLLSAIFLDIVLPISLNLIGALMISLFILSVWSIQIAAKQFKKYL